LEKNYLRGVFAKEDWSVNYLLEEEGGSGSAKRYLIISGRSPTSPDFVRPIFRTKKETHSFEFTVLCVNLPQCNRMMHQSGGYRGEVKMTLEHE